MEWILLAATVPARFVYLNPLAAAWVASLLAALVPAGLAFYYGRVRKPERPALTPQLRAVEARTRLVRRPA